MITIAVQHNDRLLRAGLACVLEREPDIEVVGHVRDSAALIHLCAETRPDVVLLEVDTTEWDAPRLVAAMRKRQRILRVVGMHGGALATVDARRIYQAGVRQMVGYDSGVDLYLAAVRGRRSLPPITSLPSDPLPAPRKLLTARECEVLGHVARGLRTQEVADVLNISSKTVENHKQRMFRKLDVQNQAHAVSVALRAGLLSPTLLAHD